MAFGGHELAMLQTDALRVNGNPMHARLQLMILVDISKISAMATYPFGGVDD